MNSGYQTSRRELESTVENAPIHMSCVDARHIASAPMIQHKTNVPGCDGLGRETRVATAASTMLSAPTPNASCVARSPGRRSCQSVEDRDGNADREKPGDPAHGL